MDIKLWMNRAGAFFQKLLQPKEEIAGLEIKDVAIRILRLEGNQIRKASVTLEPGIIEDGKIKDRIKFVANLKKLRSQFVSTQGKIPVILIVPSVNVYAQIFSTPAFSEEKLSEVAQLNLESISPIDLKSGYADWQKVGFHEKDGKIELLGAFANKSIIDDYDKALKEANFVPVAVEFPALAITRTVESLAAGIDPLKPQVVLNIGSDGINFMVLANGNLYFDYFTSWKLIKEEGNIAREILFEDFKETIIREVRKVANFYSNHWGGKLDNLILITQALNIEIAKLLKDNFSFQVIELKLRDFTDLPPSWFGVLGSALRGKISRSSDNLISLAEVGTEKAYLQSEIAFFIKIWRNIILTSLGFLVFIFLLSDTFLKYNSSQLEQKLKEVLVAPGGQEAAQLQEKAIFFNQLLAKAEIAKNGSPAFSALLSKINELLKKNIVLTRIFIDKGRSSALLSGRSSDEASTIDFKNALIKAGFENVSLPLSNIITNADGTVSFTLTFKI
ncbi:MAG: hypothetical protein Q7S73_01160 [bacterium]|nr:hypothetical protein [bacterium]